MKPNSQPVRPPVDLFEGLQAKRRTDGLAPAGLAAQRWLQEVRPPVHGKTFCCDCCSPALWRAPALVGLCMQLCMITAYLLPHSYKVTRTPALRSSQLLLKSLQPLTSKVSKSL